MQNHNRVSDTPSDDLHKTLPNPSPPMAVDNQPISDPKSVSHTRFVRQSLLGRGGNGAVYRAYDSKLKRDVAIKVPLHCVVGDPIGERIFRREVEATAKLRHPYVVTLYDFELTEFEAILVYEYVEGETLADWISKHPDGVLPREAAEVVKKIASALHHAHLANILHRDVKPSNVLLDHKQAELSNGLEPRLADFGLAQLLHDQTRTESHRQLVGSIHYIPPEVIRHSPDEYSPPSDVYSLGCVLFELLTGQRPFSGTTIAEILQRIAQGDFVLPRKLTRSMPSDLEAICLRAMALEPQNRYATAALFAEDLDRFLTHRPVLARHPGLPGMINRWARRNPAVSATIALSTAGMLGFVFLVATSNRRLSAVNETITETNRQLSEALESSRQALFHNEQLAYCDAMQNVASLIDSGRLRDARTALNRYGDGTGLERHRDFEWQHLQRRIQREFTLIRQEKQPVYCLALAGSQLFAAGAEGEVTVVDLSTRQVIHQWHTRQVEVNGIAIDAEANCVYTSGDDGTIVASELKTGRELWRVQAFGDQRAYDLVYSAKNQRLYCLGHQHAIAAVDTEKKSLATDWTSPITFGIAIRILSNGAVIVGSKRGRVFSIDAQDGDILETLVLPAETYLTGMAVANDQKVAIATSKSLILCDPKRMRELQSIPLPEAPSSISVDPKDQSYVIATKEGSVHRFVEDEQGQLQAADRWANQGERIHQIVVSPESAIYTADQSGKIVEWSRPTEDHVFVRKEDADLSMSVDILPIGEGNRWPDVAIGCDLGAYVHDFNLRSKRRLEDQTREVTSIKHWPGKQTLLGCFSGDATLLYHDKQESAPNASSRGESLGLHSHPLLTGSTDGQWIGGGSQRNDRIWLRDLARGVPSMEINAANPHVLVILPEHDIAYFNRDTAIYSCKLSRPQESIELVQFAHVPEQATVSPDGKTLAIGLSNRELHLWDIQSHSLRKEVLGHPKELTGIAFSPSGRSLLTLTVDTTLRCWNLQTGQLTLEKMLLPEASNAIIGATSFSQDLRHMALIPGDRSIHLFRLH